MCAPDPNAVEHKKGEAGDGEIVCSTDLWELAMKQASEALPLPSAEPRQVRAKVLRNIPRPVPVVVFGTGGAVK